MTVLLAPASNVLFHVGRCLGLGRELGRRGHRVVVAGTPRYLQNSAIIGRDRFEYHELPDFEPEEAMELLRSITKTPSERTVRQFVAAEVALGRRLAPDVVVVDFRLSAYISARVLGLPIVSLLLGPWMQQYSTVRPAGVRTYPQTMLLRRLIGPGGTARLTPLGLRLLARYKMRPFQRVARRYGQAPGRLLWDFVVGDCNLLLDTEAWSPTTPLPASFRRVGPILWEPDLPLPKWMDELDPDRPVVHVNFGSTAHEALFRRVFAELGGTRYQVILATGGQIEVKDSDVPPNFRVEIFVPAGKILERADLVVYHGGAGMAYLVMRAGLPSIVIATHLDQEYQGVMTEAHGVGAFLTMREVLARPGLIVETMERLFRELAPYRANVRRLQDDLARYNGASAAADCVEAFVGGWSAGGVTHA